MIKLKPYHQQILFGLLLAGLCISIFITSERPSSSVKNKGVENVIEYEVLKQFQSRSASQFNLTDLNNLCSQAIAKINAVYSQKYKFLTATYDLRAHAGYCHFAFSDSDNNGYYIASFKVPSIFNYRVLN